MVLLLVCLAFTAGLGTVMSAAIPPPIAPSEAACMAITRRVDCSGFEGLTPLPAANASRYNLSQTTNVSLCAERGCCWDQSALQCFLPGQGAAGNTTVVHVIQSSHLDIGFASPIAELINKYFDDYFPRAASIGRELRESNSTARLRWMTHPYLVSLFIDCPPGLGLHCPTAAALQTFSAAVAAGDVWWQGFSANHELALMDKKLVQHGVQVTRDLDTRFQQPHKETLSTRDVVGMPRSVIPIVKELGIKLLTEGHNGAPWPVNMPPVFVWRDRPLPPQPSLRHVSPGVSEPSGEDILVLWTDTYGNEGIYVPLPNSTHVLAYNWLGDNDGPPPNASVVEENFAFFQRAFPGAKIVASTWEDFLPEMERVKHLLPVVERESGDSWIFGPPSDPQKLAHMRIAQRLRSDCLDAGRCNATEQSFYNFSRLLLKNAEHTWGLSHDSFEAREPSRCGNRCYYRNADFHKLRASKEKWVTDFQDSWSDQRRWGIEAALEAIAGTPLEEEIRSEMEIVDNPQVPSTYKMRPVKVGQPVVLGGWAEVAVDAMGALVSLNDTRADGQQWASAAHPLGAMRYRNAADCLSDADKCELREMREQYIWPGRAQEEILAGGNFAFGKMAGTVANGARSATVTPALTAAWADETSLLLRMEFDNVSHAEYGAPAVVWLNWTAAAARGGGAADAGGQVSLEVAIFNKTATRFAEMGMISFNPAVAGGNWAMDKLGEWVDTADVMDGGSSGIHGVLSGVDYTTAAGSMFVRTADAGVVSWGEEPDAYATPIHAPVRTTAGATFVLWDNLWDTNYPLWWPYDTPGDESSSGRMLYRFQVELRS
jgi:hypothetical protein